jgi:hypothetical protein
MNTETKTHTKVNGLSSAELALKIKYLENENMRREIMIFLAPYLKEVACDAESFIEKKFILGSDNNTSTSLYSGFISFQRSVRTRDDKTNYFEWNLELVYDVSTK